MPFPRRKFNPKGGNRHRAMVNTALGIYSEAMGQRLGYGRAIEPSEVRSHFQNRSCTGHQKRHIYRVVDIRNNSAHFPSQAFSFDVAIEHVHEIAEALEAFGLNIESNRVRRIVGEAEGQRRPTRQPRTTPQRGNKPEGSLSGGQRFSIFLGATILLWFGCKFIGIADGTTAWIALIGGGAVAFSKEIAKFYEILKK